MADPVCSECGAPAQFAHPEGDVDIWACAKHACDLCSPLDGGVIA